MSRAMSPVMVAQYKRLLIPKEVLQRTFEEYLELPAATETVNEECTNDEGQAVAGIPR